MTRISYKTICEKRDETIKELKRQLKDTKHDLKHAVAASECDGREQHYGRERYELAPLMFTAVAAQTPLAWGLKFHMYQDDLEWFPKSQCVLINEDKILVPRWMIEEKGLLVNN